ncbi:hemagglutinin family protein, partial [Thermosynechococcus sp. NK55a]
IVETGNTLTLNANSNLGSGNLTLISQGGVQQNAGGGITAGGLGVKGSGTFDLNNASNDVTTFAANVSGGVTFSDGNGFSLGQVTSSVPGSGGNDTQTTTGLTTNNNDAILDSGTGGLTLSASSNLGSGNLTLISQGGVTQFGTGSITAGGLGLQGTGTFDLNNASNDVTTFAANVSGGVTFSDGNGFSVGQVTSSVPGSGGNDTQTTTGLTTNNNDAILDSGTGGLTLNASSNLGSGNLTLISQGGVQQNAGGGITAGGLGVQGNGTFDLNNAPVITAVFAANINGSLLYSGLNSVAIGTVASTVGSDSVTTSGLNIGGRQLPSNSQVTSETKVEIGGSATVATGTTKISCSRNIEQAKEENQESKSKSRLVLINGRETSVDPVTRLTVDEINEKESTDFNDDGNCVNLELNADNVRQ